MIYDWKNILYPIESYEFQLHWIYINPKWGRKYLWRNCNSFDSTWKDNGKIPSIESDLSDQKFVLFIKLIKTTITFSQLNKEKEKIYLFSFSNQIIDNRIWKKKIISLLNFYSRWKCYFSGHYWMILDYTSNLFDWPIKIVTCDVLFNYSELF